MSKKIYGITVGTPTPRSNFNQTDPRKADYIIGRENIATKEDLVETLFFTENQLPLDTSTDVTDIVTYKPTWDELIADFGYDATAETVPNLRVVRTNGMVSQKAGDVLPLLTWGGYWPSGGVTLYFGNKDYKLSLFYQYDEDTFTDITITAMLTTETAGGSIDLTDYVKNTDFANRNKHGVVALGYGWGIGCNSKGYLYTEMASKALIDERVNEYNVICPANLDYAVKSVGNGYYATEAEVEEALDAILAIQATLIGGVE